MKKKIWLSVGAVSLLIGIILFCTQNTQTNEAMTPMLPTIERGQQPTDSSSSRYEEEDTLQTASQEREASTLPVFSETQSNAWESTAQQTIPENPSGSNTNDTQNGAEPSGTEHAGGNPPETSPLAPVPTGKEPAAETDLPADTGAGAGFPILPPDIFP